MFGILSNYMCVHLETNEYIHMNHYLGVFLFCFFWKILDDGNYELSMGIWTCNDFSLLVYIHVAYCTSLRWGEVFSWLSASLVKYCSWSIIFYISRNLVVYRTTSLIIFWSTSLCIGKEKVVGCLLNKIFCAYFEVFASFKVYLKCCISSA